MEHHSEDGQPLLVVEKLKKSYGHASAFGVSHRGDALRDVSLSISSGTTLAVVGESGSGKSTLALCLAGLEKPTSGSIRFHGREITTMREEELRAIRPQIQLVFQDPVNSLNPRWTASEIVSEPLVIQGRLDKRERYDRALALLDRVGIPTSKAQQRPNEFSGGQRQRLAIARALALQPQLLILDEALSALDCSVQAQIVNLLLELQSSTGMTYLFITHDFTIAVHVADGIAVMSQGQIVEVGTSSEVVRAPKHAVTQRLMQAAMRLTTSDKVLVS
jgi:ABC-type glutathione transport system ATPase component